MRDKPRPSEASHAIDVDPADLIEDEHDGRSNLRVFESRVPFDTSHPKALAVYCSDGRFTRAVEELLERLGHARIDTLTIPGGAALLHMWSAGHAEAETVRRSTSFLIEGHRLTQVVVVAHAGCGYYRTRFPSLGAEAMIARQMLDLERASEWIEQHHRGVAVTAYLAQPEAGRIAFHSLPRQAGRLSTA